MGHVTMIFNKGSGQSNWYALSRIMEFSLRRYPACLTPVHDPACVTLREILTVATEVLSSVLILD